MNKKLLVWIVGILLGAVVVGVVWYLAFAPEAAPQAPLQPATLPISGSINPVSTSPGTFSLGVQTMTLTALDGSSMVVNDFIGNGITIPDGANAGRYLLAGDLGYCVSEPQKCQAGPVVNFNIYYNSAPQSFTIALTEEPIGQARLDMERFLLVALGVTEQQMCSLNYYVGVTRYVNERYTGKNLGFSFCPGATKLPQ
ncbi:hypothetical protein HY413_00285 [Candidatus Kaiserbacteria bacterium]|nr:hypothetical protein [Candidatus Kaiserbacteria bacterium]